MTPQRTAVRTLVRWAVMSLLVVGFAPAGAMACDDPPVTEAKLSRDMETAYRARDYAKALELGEKLHKMAPDNPEHMYNIACMQCLLGAKDKAYDWIEKAIDAGYKDGDYMANDQDFRTIRGEDRFRALVRRIRESDSPKASAKKKPPPDEDEDDEDDDNGDDDAKPVAKQKAPKQEKPKKEAKAKKPAPEDDDDDKDMSDEEKSEKVQELTLKLVEAAEKKDYEPALKYALQAQKIADISLTNYNVACMYSLLDKKDEAFKYLERAVKQGQFPFGDITEQMERDEDLNNIREDPRYKKVLEAAKKGDKPAPPGRGDGKKVKFEWKVTLPKKQDESGKAPLVVVLHGAGGNMNEAAKTWKKAADKIGAVLLTPQGTFKVGDNKFQWGRDMEAVEENVMDAIEKISQEHKIDKGKIVIAGFSQGAGAAWTVGLHNPDTFRGIIPVCGRCDTRSDSLFEDKDLAKLRVYSMCGADDDKALNKSNKDAAKKLQKKGAKVKVNTYDDVGHDYPENAEEEQIKALKFVLGE